MNFSKLKLNEAAMGDYSGLGTAAEASKGAMKSSKTQKSPDRKNMQSNLSTQISEPKVRDGNVNIQKTTEQYMSNLRRKVEEVKTYESQKSDWRTELSEALVDGQEREDHPYVTVMPTGDENLIQAIKQMRGEVKDKKQEIAKEEMTPAKMKNREDAGRRYELKFIKRNKKSKPADLSKLLPAIKKEEVEELEEGKKKCKDGYKYDSKKKKCVKKKKSSSSKKSTTVIVGRPIYGGGHHHHHHGGSGGDNGGDGGTEENTGGGDGGGVSEMFDYLADELLKEMDIKKQMEISRDFNRKSPEEQKAAVRKALGNPTKKVVKRTTLSPDGQMRKSVGKPRIGSSD